MTGFRASLPGEGCGYRGLAGPASPVVRAAFALIRFAITTRRMDRSRNEPATRKRIGRIVVRGEFGPVPATTLPECEIEVASGETQSRRMCSTKRNLSFNGAGLGATFRW
jgi:hypothetical protein